MWAKHYICAASLFLCGVAVAHADADDTPSMGLLEFLGEFQTEDGQWMDPLGLLDIEQSESTNRQKPDEEDQPNE